MALAEDEVLSDQLAYYGLRAGEYDDDLYRSPDTRERLQSVLNKLVPTGRTLELACGTGIWTELLATRVESLTAIDGAPQMLDAARHRLGESPVALVEANLFDWQPDGRYDTIFFAFWLSHVPPTRFDAFWATLRSALATGGQVLFVDTSSEEEHFERFVPGQGIPIVERQLRDGTAHKVVKMLYDPIDLADKLAAIGWRAEIRGVGGTLFAGSAVLD